MGLGLPMGKKQREVLGLKASLKCQIAWAKISIPSNEGAALFIEGEISRLEVAYKERVAYINKIKRNLDKWEAELKVLNKKIKDSVL